MSDRLRTRAHVEALLVAPIVDAYRILDKPRHERAYLLEILCPFCDGLHYHGGGISPGGGDGHRAAHCTYPGSDAGYVLREVGSLPHRSRVRRPRDLGDLADLDAFIARGERRLPTRNPIPPGQRTRILRRDGYRCRRCGNGPRDERLVIDHIMPVARGGTSEDGNLQTLCEPCNQGKADSLPDPHDFEGLR